MEYRLTKNGLETVKDYINELKAKRKEILDANNDTADETDIPTVEDIISDMSWCIGENSDSIEYLNGWGVTDNYEADYPLHLEVGSDFILIPENKKELKALCDDLSVNLGDIDTSKITDMSELFWDSDRTNAQFAGIEKWDVSNVTDMSWMFFGAEYFNKDISMWNTKKLKYAEHMFNGAVSFNQPLNSWSTEQMTNLTAMFLCARKFNQPLDKWNLANARDLSFMFEDSAFNQNITNWDISNAENLQEMFKDCKNFNQDLSDWKINANSIITDILENTPIVSDYKKLPETVFAEQLKELLNNASINEAVSFFNDLTCELNADNVIYTDEDLNELYANKPMDLIYLFETSKAVSADYYVYTSPNNWENLLSLSSSEIQDYICNYILNEIDNKELLISSNSFKVFIQAQTENLTVKK